MSYRAKPDQILRQIVKEIPLLVSYESILSLYNNLFTFPDPAVFLKRALVQGSKTAMPRHICDFVSL